MLGDEVLAFIDKHLDVTLTPRQEQVIRDIYGAAPNPAE